MAQAALKNNFTDYKVKDINFETKTIILNNYKKTSYFVEEKDVVGNGFCDFLFVVRAG